MTIDKDESGPYITEQLNVLEMTGNANADMSLHYGTGEDVVIILMDTANPKLMFTQTRMYISISRNVQTAPGAIQSKHLEKASAIKD